MMNQILQREIRLAHLNAYNTLFKLLEQKVPDFDISDFLESEGLSRELIYDLSQPLECIWLYKLNYALEEKNILPGVSLLWPLEMGLFGHGLLSYSLLACKTFGHMLTTMDRISITSHELGSTRTVVKGEIASIQIETPPALAPYRREVINDWLSTIALYSKALLPKETGSFTRLALQHDEPAYAELYREIFQCPVTFNQSEDTLYFPKSWLDLPFNTENSLPSDLAPLLTRAAESIGYREGFAEQVSQYLIQNPDIPSIKIEAIAAAFNMTTVSFRRKLYEENTSYKKLLGKIRFLIAKNYLKNTKVSLQEIAYMVGYQQTCSFHRAFKEQFGVTPKEYREQHDLSKA